MVHIPVVSTENAADAASRNQESPDSSVPLGTYEGTPTYSTSTRLESQDGMVVAHEVRGAIVPLPIGAGAPVYVHGESAPDVE